MGQQPSQIVSVVNGLNFPDDVFLCRHEKPLRALLLFLYLLRIRSPYSYEAWMKYYLNYVE